MEGVKRIKARKGRVQTALQKYNSTVWAKQGLKLNVMWGIDGGWCTINDAGPPPRPVARPAPGKPAPVRAAPSKAPVARAPVAVGKVVPQMAPKPMPTPIGKPAPNTKPPAPKPTVALQPDELVPFAQITIARDFMPSADADYAEMMFGASESEDSEDMP